MALSKEIIDDIRNSANIVDIIGHYIPLSKKGKSYVAVCPFHDDHDPSLSISQDKQIYKCFVCGNGGNCFTFVQNYKKCSFIEAVAEVADIIGKPLNIEYSVPKKENKYQHYYDLLKDFIEYTNYVLVGSKLGVEAKQYLLNRGIDEDIINEFGIGYNPDNNKVYAALKAKGYSDEDMIKVNVARMGNNGMSDVFFKRITFPIHDRYGNPVAFSARDFIGFSDSKYINSSETLIYTKGDILYNYHRAKDSSSKLASLIVCEGVMDVIAYKRVGINNVVATLGTACSAKQIELLKQTTNVVVLSYDGDKAGKAANIKIGELLLKNGINVEVIDNNTGLDPDEIVNKYEKNALRDLASKRLSYIDYAIKYYKTMYNLENYSDRKAMTLKVCDLIDILQDQYDKENYYNELYEITKIRKISNRVFKKNEYNNEVEVHNSISLDGLTKAEYTILIMMSLSAVGKDIYQKELGCLLNEDSNFLANLIIDEYRKNNSCSLSKLYDEVDNLSIKDLITNIGTIDILIDKYDETVLQGAILKVKEEIKKRKLEDLKAKIAKFEIVDPIKTEQYLQEYTKLLQELNDK